MTKILIISTDKKLSRVLDYNLTHAGFIVKVAHSRELALKDLQEIYFNLILMDFPKNHGEGVSLYQELREFGSKMPVIAMGESYQEVSILENMYRGLDDYILKPFAMSELRMIVNKQLERRRLMSNPLVYGDLKIDVAKSLVTVKDRIVSVGKKEMEILILLTRKAGKIVTTDRLVTEERMEAIKRKLKSTAGETLQIKSIKGLGYKLTLGPSCG